MTVLRTRPFRISVTSYGSAALWIISILGGRLIPPAGSAPNRRHLRPIHTQIGILPVSVTFSGRRQSTSSETQSCSLRNQCVNVAPCCQTSGEINANGRRLLSMMRRPHTFTWPVEKWSMMSSPDIHGRRVLGVVRQIRSNVEKQIPNCEIRHRCRWGRNCCGRFGCRRDRKRLTSHQIRRNPPMIVPRINQPGG